MIFLHANTFSGKRKVTFIVIGWIWWNMGVDFKVIGTLQSAVSQECINKLRWFFACLYIVSGKLKITIGMYMTKNGCDLLGPETLKSALSQE